MSGAGGERVADDERVGLLGVGGGDVGVAPFSLGVLPASRFGFFGQSGSQCSPMPQCLQSRSRPFSNTRRLLGCCSRSRPTCGFSFGCCLPLRVASCGLSLPTGAGVAASGARWQRAACR